MTKDDIKHKRKDFKSDLVVMMSIIKIYVRIDVVHQWLVYYQGFNHQDNSYFS